MIAEYIERIVESELISLLWSTVYCYEEDCPNYGDAFDLHYNSSEASTELRERLTAELAQWSDVEFYGESKHDAMVNALEIYVDQYGRDWPEQFGHDLALTRNRHGAGFWDRGLGDSGEVLTDWAQTRGELDLYVVSATEFSAE